MNSAFRIPHSAFREGVTLIELLIALAIMSILGGVNAAVLNAGFDAWNYANTRLAIQKVANELMETLLAEIELMAKEREAGGSGDKRNGHGNGDAQDDAATPAKKEIPILKV